MIAQLFSCVRTVALFFLHGLAFFLFWPAVTGGSNVTFNQRRFEAKDGSLLYLPALVNEETRILTSAICHKSETDISFLNPQPHYIQVYLRKCSGCCGSGVQAMDWLSWSMEIVFMFSWKNCNCLRYCFLSPTVYLTWYQKLQHFYHLPTAAEPALPLLHLCLKWIDLLTYN